MLKTPLLRLRKIQKKTIHELSKITEKYKKDINDIYDKYVIAIYFSNLLMAQDLVSFATIIKKEIHHAMIRNKCYKDLSDSRNVLKSVLSNEEYTPEASKKNCERYKKIGGKFGLFNSAIGKIKSIGTTNYRIKNTILKLIKIK